MVTTNIATGSPPTKQAGTFGEPGLAEHSLRMKIRIVTAATNAAIIFHTASVGVGGSTVYRTRRRFIEGNLAAALSEEPRRGAERKLTEKEEALLVATACARPPTDRARWTLELLADEMVRLTSHENLSRETVRRRLAENHIKPWRKSMWCIPKVGAEKVRTNFVRPKARA